MLSTIASLVRNACQAKEELYYQDRRTSQSILIPVIITIAKLLRLLQYNNNMVRQIQFTGAISLSLLLAATTLSVSGFTAIHGGLATTSSPPPSCLAALTERQQQFWEDVESGLDDVEDYYLNQKGLDIDRIRQFGRRCVAKSFFSVLFYLISLNMSQFKKCFFIQLSVHEEK